MVKFTHKGNLSKTTRFLQKARGVNFRKILDKYGKEGVLALAAATPRDTGTTAASWGYQIIQNGSKSSTITWTNSNTNNGVPIAILIQYGHGTGNGGYVQGRDYINPTMKPIFDKIADEAWKEVSQL